MESRDPSESSRPMDPAPRLLWPAGENEAQQLLEKAHQAPLRISAITLAGLLLTSPSVILAELRLQPALWESSTSTLLDINQGLEEVTAALESLNIFKSVKYRLTRSEDGPGSCDLELIVQEKSPFYIKAGSYVSTVGEVSGDGQLSVNNCLGRAESFQAGYERGILGTSEYFLAVMRPRPAAMPLNASMRFSQLFRNFVDTTSFMERSRSATMTLSSQTGGHSLAYEAAWRTLTDPSRTASTAVTQHLGQSLKSSLKYTRTHSASYTMGNNWKGTFDSSSKTEVAGLAFGPKVVRFVREHLQGRLTLPVPNTSATLSISLDAGVMVPIGRGAMASPSSISDRFFMGGPSSLRGFEQAGVSAVAKRRPPPPPRPTAAEGATSQHDYLGGDLSASVMAALNFDLPWESTRNIGLRAHVFLNAGNTVLLAGSGLPLKDSLRNSLRDLSSDIRCTSGVGLTMPVGALGDFEVNYCCPFRTQLTDRIRHGLQFGFTPGLH